MPSTPRRGGPSGKPLPPADPAAQRDRLLSLLGISPGGRLPDGGIQALADRCGTSPASMRHRLYGRRPVPPEWWAKAASSES